MNERSKELRVSLDSFGVEYESNVDLSSFSFFKTGGNASCIIYPTSQLQLSQSVKLLNELDCKFKVIGETSNLIFLDDTAYECLLSTTNLNKIDFDEESELIVSDCGSMLPDLARKALYVSYTGFEGLEGIPGTVGAAVYMNAGAYGDDIKKTLVAVDAILPDGSVKNYEVRELELSYRSSIFRTAKTDEIISRCYFRGNPVDAELIYSQMELLHAKRHKYQEYMYPNLGSLYSGSVYRALAKQDFVFKIISSAYLALNYKFKLFRRESPINRKWLNEIAVKRFGITYRNQPFSHKTMNTLINNGHHTDEILDYINQLQKLVGKNIPLENEIVHGF